MQIHVQRICSVGSATYSGSPGTTIPRVEALHFPAMVLTRTGRLSFQDPARQRRAQRWVPARPARSRSAGVQRQLGLQQIQSPPSMKKGPIHASGESTASLRVAKGSSGVRRGSPPVLSLSTPPRPPLDPTLHRPGLLVAGTLHHWVTSIVLSSLRSVSVLALFLQLTTRLQAQLATEARQHRTTSSCAVPLCPGLLPL